jgi:hypothetical protein
MSNLREPKRPRFVQQLHLRESRREIRRKSRVEAEIRLSSMMATWTDAVEHAQAKTTTIKPKRGFWSWLEDKMYG